MSNPFIRQASTSAIHIVGYVSSSVWGAVRCTPQQEWRGPLGGASGRMAFWTDRARPLYRERNAEEAPFRHEVTVFGPGGREIRPSGFAAESLVAQLQNGALVQCLRDGGANYRGVLFAGEGRCDGFDQHFHHCLAYPRDAFASIEIEVIVLRLT